MLLFAVLVAGSFALGGLAAPFIDPMVLNTLRFIIAAAILWALVLATGQLNETWKQAPWRYVILAALYAGYFVSMFEGLKTADPVGMAAVFTLTPGMTALVGYVIVSQLTTPRAALAIVVGAVGALWVIFKGDIDAARAFEIGRGEFIYFWGCVAHAFFAPLLKKYDRGEPTLVFNGCILAVAAIGLGLWSAPAWPKVEWSSLPLIVWTTLLYISTFATVVSLFLLRYAATRIPSAKVMAYTYLVPSTVIVWQFGLGQSIALQTILPGIALTFLSLFLLLKNDSSV